MNKNTMNTNMEQIEPTPTRRKRRFRKGLCITLTCIALTIALPIVFMTQLVSWAIKASTASATMATEQQYAAELQAFDSKATEYGIYLFSEMFDMNNGGLNDLEYFDKIMYDMWSNIDGYGEPQMNLTGALRLDIVSGNGVGVCRNMADYMVSVIKAANLLGEYSNPRRICVDMSEDGEFAVMHIDRNILKPEEEINDKAESYWDNSFAVKYAANHVIVAIDYKNAAEDVEFTLLIDPTNPSYGYLKDGEIVWINSAYDRNGNPNNQNPTTYTYKKLADYEMGDNHSANTKAIRRSKHLSQKSEDYIWSHFDYSNQEAALEQVKTIDDQEYVAENFFRGAIQDVLDFYKLAN